FRERQFRAKHPLERAAGGSVDDVKLEGPWLQVLGNSDAKGDAYFRLAPAGEVQLAAIFVSRAKAFAPLYCAIKGHHFLAGTHLDACIDAAHADRLEAIIHYAGKFEDHLK